METTKCADRTGFIGGSDVGAILGVSPYKTPVQVWLEKTGRAKPFEGNNFTYWGVALEAIVADEYSQQTGRKLIHPSGPYIHPEQDFIRGQLDRLVEGQPGGLECKTAGRRTERWGEPGTDQVPNEYLAQCAHYMACASLEWMDVAVLFMAEREFSIYRINRDYDLEAALIAQVVAFWHDYVKADKAPDWLGANDLTCLFPESKQHQQLADAEMENDVERLREVRHQMMVLKDQEEEIANAIKARMGEAESLVSDEGEVLVTWKTTKPRTTIDQKRLEKFFPEAFSSCRKEGASSRRFVIK